MGKKDGHSHADKTFPVFSSALADKAPPSSFSYRSPSHTDLQGLFKVFVHLMFPDDADPIVFLKDS